eukprot:gnl/MRDRNA2_/MRDRNA2_98349_c0_seq1.p1 gnl/MRDRNA2_/MRDRNA2_98349_c0~~gnl/MRDRNA2_/MRDRNA2_98349_c0_seq1.p1  ORF type:complete len:121 (+),score=29.27 gnl/MRDRNA2_/MRDRNA2_98349_c0_seq1:33-365(+)
MPRGLVTAFIEALGDVSFQLHSSLVKTSSLNPVHCFTRKHDLGQAEDALDKAIGAGKQTADAAFTVEVGEPSEHVFHAHNEAAAQVLERLTKAKAALKGEEIDKGEDKES